MHRTQSPSLRPVDNGAPRWQQRSSSATRLPFKTPGALGNRINKTTRATYIYVRRTGPDGKYRFVGIKPVSYPIPVDGPVGQMLAALGRHPYRPAYIVTNTFVGDVPYLKSEAVFRVKDRLPSGAEATLPVEWRSLLRRYASDLTGSSSSRVADVGLDRANTRRSSNNPIAASERSRSRLTAAIMCEANARPSACPAKRLAANSPKAVAREVGAIWAACTCSVLCSV